MKTIEYLTHTADIRMRVKADSEVELFEAALEGMNNVVKPGECDQHRLPTIGKMMYVKSNDLTSLLVEFMGEVLTLTHTYKAIFCTFNIKRLKHDEIDVLLWGVDVDEFDEDIKAVTYHQAQVERNDEGQWETIIVFDI